jgi:hypothetical protein
MADLDPPAERRDPTESGRGRLPWTRPVLRRIEAIEAQKLNAGFEGGVQPKNVHGS